MAKLYGIGAAVVIIGAMFKIQHWPFASLLLVVGLSTEAVIFFFSAFEPLHEIPDAPTEHQRADISLFFSDSVLELSLRISLISSKFSSETLSE